MKTKIISLLILVTLMVASTLLIQPASALQMNPISVVVKPTGGGTKQSFKVVNEERKPIAVQFSVMTRQQINNKKPASFVLAPPPIPAGVVIAGTYSDAVKMTVTTQ